MGNDQSQRVTLTTLNKLLSNTTLDQSAREKSLGCYKLTDRQLILLKWTWHIQNSVTGGTETEEENLLSILL